MRKDVSCPEPPPFPAEVPASGISGNPLFLVFTDLDGTLLDHDSYGWEKARDALDRCRERHVPVILVSSKTRAEMEPLRRRMGLAAPFVSENGGGIFFPEEIVPGPRAPGSDGLWEWPLGEPYSRLVRALRGIREDLGWPIRGFSDMDIREISERTGLDTEHARLAAMREFDEPFVILKPGAPDREMLARAAAERGLTVTEGGRFFHLKGRNDKGLAMEKIVSWYRRSHPRVISVALGDGPNDLPMLKRADHPVFVRSGKGASSPGERVPGLRVAAETGPEGWNSAVLDILFRKEETDHA